jgi:hypothetical protein
MDIPLNTVILYEHADYTGKQYVINLGTFVPNAVHSFSGHDLQDKASAVRWRLPPGRVVTLLEHFSRPTLPDLSGVGRTFDLIGDGAAREIHLGNADINDCLSAFFWRDVDLSRGYITFYKDSDFRNIRQTVFLAEWAPNKAHSISNWAMQDRMTSVRWVNLDPRVVIGLYDTTSAGGAAYTNITRRDGSVEGSISSLSVHGMQDKVSSFKIMELLPVIEEIKSIELDRRNFPRQSVTIDAKGSVTGTQIASTYTANVAQSWIESSSVTLEQSHRVGGSASYQYSSGSGNFGKHTFKFTVSYDYTKTRSDTASKSEELKITHQETYPIPPNHNWQFKLILRYDQIDTDFTTEAIRWYSQRLSDTVEDTTKSPGKTLYRRVEVVKGRLTGSFCFDTQSSFVTNPL